MTDPTPRIHDRDVARLPLQDARADLLEEIMATPVVDQLDHRTSRRPAPAWLAVSAAAAAIAAIALVPAVRSALADPAQAPVATGPSVPTPPPASAKPEHGLTSVPGGKYVALDAPGWSLTYLYTSENETDIAYSKGEQSLEMVQYPADAYDSYFEDRVHVSDPVATELLGKPSSTFTYSEDDHATMRPAQNGSFLEVRGSGMDLAAYHGLLDRIVQTDERGLAGIPCRRTSSRRSTRTRRSPTCCRAPTYRTASPPPMSRSPASTTPTSRPPRWRAPWVVPGWTCTPTAGRPRVSGRSRPSTAAATGRC